MAEEIYVVRIEGVRPLLMNNPYGPLGISNEPKRRRGEHLDPKTEAELRLYKDEDGNIVIPARNVKAMIRDAARQFRAKQRKMTYAGYVRAGIEIEPTNIPLEHDGWEPFVTICRIQSSRVLVSRPMFKKWALEFKIINKDPNMLPAEILKKILEEGGKWYGLCDYRPDFGLFKLVKFEKQK